MDNNSTGTEWAVVGDGGDAEPADEFQDCLMTSVYSPPIPDVHDETGQGHDVLNDNLFAPARACNTNALNSEVLSSDGESETSCWDDEDDEDDELRPASVTEDDVENLDDEFDGIPREPD